MTSSRTRAGPEPNSYAARTVSSMIIHHLNCGSMHTPSAELVCHVLLLETANGLVLIDTGFGLDDIADPKTRIGPNRRLLRPAFDPAETAIRQVERLGFQRDDVRHIVVTHFDLDHIGGISDFPSAQVHVTAAEALGSMWSPSRREKLRYRTAQWSHGPAIVEHDPSGEEWLGFAAAKPLTQVDPGVVMVSLPGHTRGHAAIAVHNNDTWLLQAGDAFFHRQALDGVKQPFALETMENMIAFDRKQVQRNHERLAELHRKSSSGNGTGHPLSIINAHDPELLARHAK
jgi:glyoxylase-like metal-dependent hydrolase (beta-lactamase superfamily II)